MVFQCLTQCPQARLHCSRMPYGAVFSMEVSYIPIAKARSFTTHLIIPVFFNLVDALCQQRDKPVSDKASKSASVNVNSESSAD